MARVHSIGFQRYELFASCLNAISAGLITVGVFTPLAAWLYGIGEPKNLGLIGSLPIVCILGALALHLLGQLAIDRLDVSDDQQ